MAYTVIYFIRLLVSFSKKDLDSQTQIPGSTSYVAIDVHDDTSPCENKPVSLINFDQRKIIDMVKEKSLEILKHLGGVSQVAIILETDVNYGVGEVDVAHRRDVFGENSYKKPPAKRFLSYVLEACKDPTIIILLFCAIMSLGFAIKLHGLRVLGNSRTQSHTIYVVRQLAYSTELLVCINEAYKQYKQRSSVE